MLQKEREPAGTGQPGRAVQKISKKEFSKEDEPALLEKHNYKLIEQLFKSEHVPDSLAPEWLKKKKRKKHQYKPRL